MYLWDHSYVSTIYTRYNFLKKQMKRAKNQVPLIIESHPVDYNGYPFVTLIQYHKKTMLTIVNNIDESSVEAFVLDLCGPQHVNEEAIIAVAAQWYENGQNKPLSFEFSKLDVLESAQRIFRTFNIDYVTRIIGPIHKFDLNPTSNVKRRKRKNLPKTTTN